MKLKLNEQPLELVLETDKEKIQLLKQALGKLDAIRLQKMGLSEQERAVIINLYFGFDDVLKVI